MKTCAYCVAVVTCKVAYSHSCKVRLHRLVLVYMDLCTRCMQFHCRRNNSLVYKLKQTHTNWYFPCTNPHVGYSMWANAFSTVRSILTPLFSLWTPCILWYDYCECVIVALARWVLITVCAVTTKMFYKSYKTLAFSIRQEQFRAPRISEISWLITVKPKI